MSPPTPPSADRQPPPGHPLAAAARWLILPYWIALTLATHWPGLDLRWRPVNTDLIQLDKAMHVAAFAMLMALWLARRAAATRTRAYRLTGLLLVMLYAAVDEYTQSWVGRSVAFEDFLAGTTGALCVAVLEAAASRQPEASVSAAVRRGARLAWLVLIPLGGLLTLLPAVGQWAIRNRHRWPAGLPDPDRILHVAASVALIALLVLSEPLGRRRPAGNALLVIAILGGSTYLIEAIQSAVGREVSVDDVYHHFLGMAIGLLGWMLVLLRYDRHSESTAPMDPALAEGEAA